MSLFASNSIFRSLLLAAAGALLLAGHALADDHRGGGRDNDRSRGPDRQWSSNRDRNDHRDRSSYRGWQNGRDRDRDRTRVVVNWNTRPYWHAPRPAYYRPMVVYRDPYPYYYANYTTFQPIMMTPAAYNAFEYTQPNMPVVMNNDTYSYTLTPGPVTDEGQGRYCREYQAKVNINNTLQNSYGQACRQPDGSWEIVS